MSVDLILTFLEAKSVDTDASKNTIKAYSTDLEKYFKWISTKKVSVLEAQLWLIEEYLVKLKDRGLSISSRARHLSSIKQFIGFEYLSPK